MDAAPIIDRYTKLRALRDGYYIATFREVRKYVYPTYSDFLTEGGSRGQDLADTTAVFARSRLAAGIYNWMAPPDKRWFELAPQDDELARNEEVKDYFAEVSKAITIAMANSNWATVLIETLEELAAGLDGIVYCEEGSPGSPLVFRMFPVETVCYAENADGKVDTVYREVQLTARQLLQKFAADDIPENIRAEAADLRQQDKKYTLLHAVFPRTHRDPDLADQKNMPFCDIYIELSTRKIIREGGFAEFPFAVCRFQKSGNESYGRGPGLNALPDIKTLNRMVAAYLLAREHQADPSILAPDGSLLDEQFDRDPGALILYKPGMNNEKPEVFRNATELHGLANDIELARQRIKFFFFSDIFDPLGELKSITATEAEIRNESKMIPFAPIAGNLHDELFRPLIHRVFGILSRSMQLPELPAVLADNPDYKIEFVSKIALAIKKIEAVGWLQTEAAIANIAGVKPEIMDNFQLDELARNIALSYGVDPGILTPVKERDKLRADRAAAAQERAAMEQLLSGAGTLGSNLSKTPEPGSPLDAVMNGEGV